MHDKMCDVPAFDYRRIARRASSLRLSGIRSTPDTARYKKLKKNRYKTIDTAVTDL
jgi:hypothetical protein